MDYLPPGEVTSEDLANKAEKVRDESPEELKKTISGMEHNPQNY